MSENTEVIIRLANGNTLRSGSETHTAGDYVRVCDSEGNELTYWDHMEWQEDPVSVMGAIFGAANKKD